jgi:hypothetical protein
MRMKLRVTKVDRSIGLIPVVLDFWAGICSW